MYGCVIVDPQLTLSPACSCCLPLEPENGCEIQNAACGRSGIMMELHVVKGPSEEALALDDDDHNLLHGCKVMLHLLRHWTSAKWRVVCADSAFASVQAALRLYEKGFRFIGVIKQSTTNYPKKYLGEVMLPVRGASAALVTKVEETTVMAFVYCDKNRYYFVTTCSNMCCVDPIYRVRLRQVQPVESGASPESVAIALNVPRAAQVYYSANGAIDQHNWIRQDTVQLERKIQTKVWHKRVNTTILGIILEKCTRRWMTAVEYYRRLIQELIENKFASSGVVRRSMGGDASVSAVSLASTTGTAGRGLHITPTRRLLEDGDSDKKRYKQSRCRMCGTKTVMVCSECRLNPEFGEVGASYCGPLSGQTCYKTHMERDR